MVRRVELTSGIGESYGLLYRATLEKAVMRRCPHEGFLTRNDGLRYTTVMPRSACSSTSWLREYCGMRGTLR